MEAIASTGTDIDITALSRKQWSDDMADLSNVAEHMEVIGADGTHIGTVDKVEG